MDKEINAIMIFQEQFELLIDGVVDEHQACELIRMLYYYRFLGEDYKDEKELDPVVRGIWRAQKPTFKKSKQNANNYKKKKMKEQISETITQKLNEEPSDFLPETYNIIKENETDIDILKGQLNSDAPYDRLQGLNLLETLCKRNGISTDKIERVKKELKFYALNK